MQVLLIAHTTTTQLAPLTERFAAPLLPLVDQPVMATAVELLARAGCKRLVVALDAQGEPVRNYFGDGRRFGLQIEYLLPGVPPASLLRAETTLLLPAAALIDLDVAAALAYHQASGAALTCIWATRSANQQPQPTGAAVFEPQLLPLLGSLPLHQFISAVRADSNTCASYQMQGYWNPMDSLAAYQEAVQVYLYSAYVAAGGPADQALLQRVRYPSLHGLPIAPGVWVGTHSTIARSARLTPPVVIGDNCRVGHQVELGPSVVIGPATVIDNQATVARSIVLAGSYIGRLVRCHDLLIDRSTLFDPHSNASIQVVDRFLLAEVSSQRLRLRRWLRRLLRRPGQLANQPLLNDSLALRPERETSV